MIFLGIVPMELLALNTSEPIWQACSLDIRSGAIYILKFTGYGCVVLRVRIVLLWVEFWGDSRYDSEIADSTFMLTPSQWPGSPQADTTPGHRHCLAQLLLHPWFLHEHINITRYWTTWFSSICCANPTSSVRYSERSFKDKIPSQRLSGLVVSFSCVSAGWIFLTFYPVFTWCFWGDLLPTWLLRRSICGHHETPLGQNYIWKVSLGLHLHTDLILWTAELGVEAVGEHE